MSGPSSGDLAAERRWEELGALLRQIQHLADDARHRVEEPVAVLRGCVDRAGLALQPAVEKELLDRTYRLRSLLEGIGSLAAKAASLGGGEAVDKVDRGMLPSRSEYHLLAQLGQLPRHMIVTAKDLGVSPVDDYEAFAAMFYEDDDQYTVINPSLKPVVWETGPNGTRSARISLRHGSAPEELWERYLRPEQRELFREYLPELYARFRRTEGPSDESE